MHTGSIRKQFTVLVLLVSAMLTCAPLALAVFNKTVVGGPLTVGTSTLAAPGTVSAAQVNCRGNKTPEIEVTWSASSSSYATSYAVERATAGSGPYTPVASVAIGKATYLDSSVALAYATTYYYRVSTAYRSWSSASATASVKTLSKSCI
jgi:hypothetical protein